MNVVENFIRRVREFSTNLSKEKINTIIEDHLKTNHYPSSLRHRFINNNKKKDPPRSTQANAMNTQYRSLPFVNGLTSKLRHNMKNDFPNITLATRFENTTNRFFSRTKDPIPKNMNNNIVYCIPCNECPAKYVGHSTNYLKKRLSGHTSNITLLDKLLGEYSATNSPTKKKEIEDMKQKTALVQHCIETQHRFNFENTVILDQSRRRTALPVLEVCHIINTDATVNLRSDVDALSTTYAGILHSLKEKNQNKRYNTQTPAEEPDGCIEPHENRIRRSR